MTRQSSLPPAYLTIFCQIIRKMISLMTSSQQCARGKQRAAIADWSDIAVGPAAFQSSSDAVFRWAPIADELKCDDEEILRNSIHLRWIGVRRDLKAVFQHAAIADDWHRHGATSAAQPAAK
jgi:hypothetical protein